jgi:hypothetical protein
MSNVRLMQKADLEVSNLASHGKLNVEQSNEFIRLIRTQPTILNAARMQIMSAPERKINKIGFGSRILKPGVENTALSAGDRSVPVTSGLTLTTKEVMAEVRLTYDTLEDNIEGGSWGGSAPNGPVSGRPASGGLRDTIMALIAEKVAEDLEELAILGDTGSGDAYLALTNGYVALASTNVFDNSSAGINKAALRDAVKTMPDQYLRNRNQMRHFVSVDNEIDYRDTLAGRETAMGDSQFAGTGPIYGSAVAVSAVPQMPEDKGLLTHPKNLIWGIQRDISMEMDKDITSRTIIIVVTARVDFQIEETLAIVRTDNLT